MKVLSGQSSIVVKMEKLLVTWMDHRKCHGFNLTFDDAKNKAMECYSYLKEKETALVPYFSASTGWFYKLSTRYGFHSVKRLGEAKNAEEDAAASFPDRLRAIIEEGGGGGGGTSHSRCSTWMKAVEEDP